MNSRTSKIAGIALTALTILASMPLQAGTIRANVQGIRTDITSTGGDGETPETKAASNPSRINLAIRGKRGEVSRITIRRSGINNNDDRYSQTEVITKRYNSYASWRSYVSKYRLELPSRTISGTRRGTANVKVRRSGRISVTLRRNPYSYTGTDFDGVTTFRGANSAKLTITGNIKRKKLLRYRLLLTDTYRESNGDYENSKTDISGKGTPRGNVN